MNNTKQLETAVGLPVEEWTIEALLETPGDFTDIYTDETIDEIIRRSEGKVHEVYLCMKVSREYQASCDKLSEYFKTFSEDKDEESFLENIKNMLSSDIVWDRFVIYWAASDPLYDATFDFDFDIVRQDILDIFNMINAIDVELGIEIISDVVDHSTRIGQVFYEKYNENSLEDTVTLNECLEKMNLATYNFYDVLRDEDENE